MTAQVKSKQLSKREQIVKNALANAIQSKPKQEQGLTDEQIYHEAAKKVANEEIQSR